MAARKVTAGSPLNSCKLLAAFGEAGGRKQESGVCLSEGSLCKTLFVAPHIAWKLFFPSNRLGLSETFFVNLGICFSVKVKVLWRCSDHTKFSKTACKSKFDTSMPSTLFACDMDVCL